VRPLFLFKLCSKKGFGLGPFKSPESAYYGDSQDPLTAPYSSFCFILQKIDPSPSSNSRAAALLRHKFLPPQVSKSSLFGVVGTRISK